MAAPESGHSSAVRIIGGLWRGRKLTFPSSDELRPTADRVRETLFNWLAGKISDARCLDLFAGSGALGLEAMSRGAAGCLWVDNSMRNCDAIRTHLHTLGIADCACLQTDALVFLDQRRGQHKPMDIVFLDPPFNQGWLEPVCAKLEQNTWLAQAAHIYVETARREAQPEVPGNWTLYRDKTAGEVRYQLFVRSA